MKNHSYFLFREKMKEPFFFLNKRHGTAWFMTFFFYWYHKFSMYEFVCARACIYPTAKSHFLCHWIPRICKYFLIYMRNKNIEFKMCLKHILFICAVEWNNIFHSSCSWIRYIHFLDCNSYYINARKNELCLLIYLSKFKFMTLECMSK